MLPTLLLTLGATLGSVPLVLSLGTSCTTPLGAGTAAAGDPFWMQNIKHQGIAAFNADPSTYQVFRNVMDFGAKGDGVTDDAAAINLAITTGNRCGDATCNSTTITPAVVFFPKGTYLIGNSIIPYYYTQLIGDATSPPTLLAAATFTDFAIIDADPYIPGGGGAQWYTNQNNFFRSVRNFVIDTTRVPAGLSQGTGIHWQVSQSTSLMNIVINLSAVANTAHQGIWMENGSGGFMGDLIINGGKYGLWVGNQQFTVRNVTITNAQTAILGSWNWGWTFQDLNIANCGIGLDLLTGSTAASQVVGAEAIIDATVSDTPIFLRTSTSSNGQLVNAGSLVLNNIKLTNVPTAVGVVDGTVVLEGGTTTIAFWGQGNVYSGSSSTPQFTQGIIVAPSKPAVLLDSSGKFFGRTHPQYATYAVDQFVSVRDQGGKGDGTTDDTAALKAIFAAYAGCKIIFFDAGTYVVTSTLQIPAGTQVVGEGWSVIAGKGAAFQDVNNPEVVVQVGATGSSGVVEITDIIFSTIGPAPGAIVVEWNVKETTQGGAGMWDSHIRLGGAAGTDLELNCPIDGSGGFPTCAAAFLALHLTSSSTAYLEGTWVWLADHDLDANAQTQISLYSGRGVLSESAGPVWMIGTGAEHHTLYQYNLVGAANHYMGLIQTETPYYQPTPAPPGPFVVNSAFNDPSFTGVSAAWGLVVSGSSNILIFGAGLYSFYSDYDQTCLTAQNCQSQILNIDSTSSVSIYSLQTVGTTWQLSINGAGIIKQDSNPNGFAATVTSWTR
ncbi:exo-beta-1,3-glucanase [Mycena alexandri]|uniref:Exo-beta-1,3-glucanase n=1 Tax=Mycena alexandri TaxID=1745969 RepID=A0AAD6TB12_9AGAR|nr:exo-beta-1,3-glucanase [Mycena alexandri]